METINLSWRNILWSPKISISSIKFRQKKLAAHEITLKAIGFDDLGIPMEGSNAV